MHRYFTFGILRMDLHSLTVIVCAFYCQDFPFFFRGCEVINYHLGYAESFFQPLIADVFLLCIPHSIKQETRKKFEGKAE